jgi:hypothetical protein
MDDGVLRTRGCRRHAGSPTDFKLPPVRRSRTRDCCTEQPHALSPNPLPLYLIKFANRIQYKQVLLSSKVSGTYLGIGCQNDIVKWNIMTCNIMTNSEGKGLAGDKEKSGRLLQENLSMPTNQFCIFSELPYKSFSAAPIPTLLLRNHGKSCL